MATNYPGSLDDFATTSPAKLSDDDSTGRTHAERHNDVESAVEAVQAVLGTNPAGAQATVKDRIQLGLRGTITSNITTWAVGSYLSNNAFAGTSSGQVSMPSANATYFTPFFVPETVTIDRIAVWVSTLQTNANCRIGRYALNSNGLPTGSVLNDWGEIDASSTGYKELTISTSLSEGWHCMAVINEVASVSLRGADVARVVNQDSSGSAGVVAWTQGSTTYTSGFTTVGTLTARSGVGTTLFYLRRSG